MLASYLVTLVAAFTLVGAAPAPAPQSSSTSCTDKCTVYQTWMDSCSSYDPNSSGWPATCTAYCTDSSKQKAYTDCTACKTAAGTGGDNGSLTRICTQLKTLGKVANNTKTSSASSSAESADPSASGTKKSAATAASVGLGAVALAGAGMFLL